MPVWRRHLVTFLTENVTQAADDLAEALSARMPIRDTPASSGTDRRAFMSGRTLSDGKLIAIVQSIIAAAR